MISLNKRFVLISLSALGTLLFPLIAMIFTNEVNWSVSDFVVMGILLLCFATAIEVVIRKTNQNFRRVVIVGLTVIIFLLIWVELAVGIFGTPFSGS